MLASQSIFLHSLNTLLYSVQVWSGVLFVCLFVCMFSKTMVISVKLYIWLQTLWEST